MPKEIPAQEAFVDMLFPVHGVDISTEFQLQRPQTAREGVNVRAFEPTTFRGRGGSRPGLLRYLNDQLNGTAGLVQHLNFVVTSDSDYSLAVDEDNRYLPDPRFPIDPEGEFDPSTNNWYDGFPPGPRYNDPRWFRNPGRAVHMNGSGIQPKRNYPHEDKNHKSAAAALITVYIQESNTFTGFYGADSAPISAEFIEQFTSTVPTNVVLIKRGGTAGYHFGPEDPDED